MKTVKVTFRKMIDSQIFSSLLSNEMGYWSVSDRNFEIIWNGINVSAMHLNDCETGLPMHYEANTRYWFKDPMENAEILKKMLPSVTNEELQEVDGRNYRIYSLEERYRNDHPSIPVLRYENETIIKRLLQEGIAYWNQQNDALWGQLDDGTTQNLIYTVYLNDCSIAYDTPTIEYDRHPLPFEVIGDYYEGKEIQAGQYEFLIFKSHEDAGEAARAYWADMAQHDKREFVEIVGKDTIVSWALGELAGPGTVKVDSLENWLDIYLEHPEEELARYDGQEQKLYICPFARELLGWDCEEVYAYRTN